MSLYLLSPLPAAAADPAWALSWQAEPCEILAETAEQARSLAAGKFTLAVHPGSHVGYHFSPWLNPGLVKVSRQSA